MPYVFGYGSLLNDSYTAISYATLIPNSDFPVRRAFNAHCVMGGNIQYAALGLEYVPYALATRINGLIIDVTAGQFNEIVEREKGYRQVRLDIACFTWLSAAIEEDIIVFVPEVPAYPTGEYPLNKVYIDACIEGFSRCNRQYALEFLQSTSGWSPDLLEYALGRLQ
jgi:hypothetical protein